MTIKVQAFGIAKEIIGGNAVNLTVEDIFTVQDLRSLLGEQYPKLKQLKSFMIALNNQYAQGPEHIMPNDEIAIIPPVSGG